MAPTVILVRHAQAWHNDYSYPDPVLTELGLAQCEQLHKSLENDLAIAKEVGLIVVSPMRRTLQTALVGLRSLINKNVPVLLKAEVQENSDKPCDVGTSVSMMKHEFPSVSFDTVDPFYPSKTGHYAFTQEAILKRAADFRAWLKKRPEKVIAVVSHSGFLRVGVSNCAYANADYRVFDFANEKPGNGDALIEWELTREKGGGLGHSEKGWFGVASSNWANWEAFKSEKLREKQQEREVLGPLYNLEHPPPTNLKGPGEVVCEVPA